MYACSYVREGGRLQKLSPSANNGKDSLFLPPPSFLLRYDAARSRTQGREGGREGEGGKVAAKAAGARSQRRGERGKRARNRLRSRLFHGNVRTLICIIVKH